MRAVGGLSDDFNGGSWKFIRSLPGFCLERGGGIGYGAFVVDTTTGETKMFYLSSSMENETVWGFRLLNSDTTLMIRQ